jgi:NitT/TauT family transport system substrate-binding protein
VVSTVGFDDITAATFDDRSRHHLDTNGRPKRSSMSPRSTCRAGRRTHLGIIVAAIMAIGALTACGSSGGSGGGSATTTGATANITVLRSTGSTFEPLYIAEEQGFFKAAGLNVTIKAGAADTSQNAPSIVNGEAQFAMTDSSGFLKAAAQKLPVRIVSALQAATTKTPPSDGLLVKPDSTIKSFADVGGKTIGLPALGGTLQFICQYFAKQAGVDPSAVKFVALPSASLVDAVKNGQVDGAYLFATFLDAGKAAGLRAIGIGTNALPGLPQAVLFAGQTWLSGNADAAKRFIDAVAKGVDYANSHPDDVRAVDAKYTTLPADYIKNRTIQIFSTPVNTVVMKTIIAEMVTYKIIKATPDENTLYWDQMPKTTTSE